MPATMCPPATKNCMILRYDLATDPQEWNDLYANTGALEGRLQAMKTALLEHLGKQIRLVNPLGHAR